MPLILQQVYLWLCELLNIQVNLIYRVTIEITLATDVTNYTLNEYQRLADKSIKRLVIPYSANLTKSPTNKTIASEAAIDNAYITLVSKGGSNQIFQTIPLLDYKRDNAYENEKNRLNLNTIDFTQSYISYPDATIPNANNGKSILLLFDYQYPVNSENANAK